MSDEAPVRAKIGGSVGFSRAAADSFNAPQCPP
jgi:hypothetical protein